MTERCKWCKKGKVFSQGICKQCYINALSESPEIGQILKENVAESIEDDEPIDETNYRKHAKIAIKMYYSKNMLADVIFWSHIIGLYEKDLKKLKGG